MKVKKNILKFFISGLVVLLSSSTGLNGQKVPGDDENIPWLVTFGKNGDTSWGDDDFSQTWFYAIPKDYKGKFYIRVFDPDTGGENDEGKGDWDTKMKYTVYGGKGVDPEKPGNEDSRGIQPTGKYNSGTVLASQVFGNDKKYDGNYYTFGPFNPSEGDYSERWGYIFKIICDGLSGDDGNLYRYSFSSEKDKDVPIEGANAFTYEYTFRMWNNISSVSHIYPYIDEGVIWVKVQNFDWDSDGKILVISKVKQGIEVPISAQNNWVEYKIPIEKEEAKSSLDIQFHKYQGELIRNNNVVISLENQRGDNLKFFSSPIGGVPKYDPKTRVTKVGK
jgi:hypothetical protein